jgi:hypothetical protein
MVCRSTAFIVLSFRNLCMTAAFYLFARAKPSRPLTTAKHIRLMGSSEWAKLRSEVRQGELRKAFRAYAFRWDTS